MTRTLLATSFPPAPPADASAVHWQVCPWQDPLPRWADEYRPRHAGPLGDALDRLTPRSEFVAAVVRWADSPQQTP